MVCGQIFILDINKYESKERQCFVFRVTRLVQQVQWCGSVDAALKMGEFNLCKVMTLFQTVE